MMRQAQRYNAHHNYFGGRTVKIFRIGAAAAGFTFSLGAQAGFTTPDTGFGGGDGVVEYSVGSNVKQFRITSDSKGRIYVHIERTDFTQNTLMRLRANGTKDSCFGEGNGSAAVTWGVRAIAVDEHRRLVYGLSYNNQRDPSDFDFAIATRSIDGLNAGPGGFVGSFNVPKEAGEGDLAVSPGSGALVVAAFQEDTLTNSYRAITFRVFDGNAHEDGVLDTLFGTSGFKTDGGNNSNVAAAAVDIDDKIIAAGFSAPTGSQPYGDVIYRYLPNGARDTSFSSDGKQNLNPSGTGYNNWVDARVRGDGVLRLVGLSATGVGPEETFTGLGLIAAQLKYNGTLDTSFDGDGKFAEALPSVAGMDFYDAALEIMHDGRFILARLLAGKLRVESYNGFGAPLVFVSSPCVD